MRRYPAWATSAVAVLLVLGLVAHHRVQFRQLEQDSLAALGELERKLESERRASQEHLLSFLARVDAMERDQAARDDQQRRMSSDLQEEQRKARSLGRALDDERSANRRLRERLDDQSRSASTGPSGGASTAVAYQAASLPSTRPIALSHDFDKIIQRLNASHLDAELRRRLMLQHDLNDGLHRQVDLGQFASNHIEFDIEAHRLQQQAQSMSRVGPEPVRTSRGARRGTSDERGHRRRTASSKRGR